MEHGTNILGEELNKLWRNVADPVGPGHGHEDGAAEAGGERVSVMTARRRRDWGGEGRNEDVGGGGGGVGGGSNGRRPNARPTLPPEEVDALLNGLARLQSEMEAEVGSFQKQKAELVRRLEKLDEVGGKHEGAERVEYDGAGWGRDCALDEVMALEEQAESMRAGVVASLARLLERVREVRCFFFIRRKELRYRTAK